MKISKKQKEAIEQILNSLDKIRNELLGDK